jgi:hypothetical protein
MLTTAPKNHQNRQQSFHSVMMAESGEELKLVEGTGLGTENCGLEI